MGSTKAQPIARQIKMHTRMIDWHTSQRHSKPSQGFHAGGSLLCWLACSTCTASTSSCYGEMLKGLPRELLLRPRHWKADTHRCPIVPWSILKVAERTTASFLLDGPTHLVRIMYIAGLTNVFGSWLAARPWWPDSAHLSHL